MRNHVVRLYALAGMIAVFFLSWAAVAARPWNADSAPAAAPARVVEAQVSADKTKQVSAQEKRLRRKASRLERLIAEIGSGSTKPRSTATAPVQVAVTSSPPVTQTRSS